MWNRKLNKRIAALEARVNELESKISNQQFEINRLSSDLKAHEWKLDNPPKYKKGDKIKNLIVLGVELNKPDKYRLGWALSFFALANINFDKELLDYSSYKPHWKYTLSNIVSGEKYTLTQSELDNTKKDDK